MNNDIVDTLRRNTMYIWTSRINPFGMTVIGFELTSFNLIAADEIERLRKERDEAEPLLQELWERRTESTEMRAEIERLRKELDTRIAMCDMRSERIIELENLIDSAMEADHNNEYFRTHHK